MAERRRFLDEPYIVQRVALEQIQALLRPLARTDLSPLPLRMRTACARMHRQCAAFARELRRVPEHIALERSREDAAAARRPRPRRRAGPSAGHVARGVSPTDPPGGPAPPRAVQKPSV